MSNYRNIFTGLAIGVSCLLLGITAAVIFGPSSCTFDRPQIVPPTVSTVDSYPVQFAIQEGAQPVPDGTLTVVSWAIVTDVNHQVSFTWIKITDGTNYWKCTVPGISADATVIKGCVYSPVR